MTTTELPNSKVGLVRVARAGDAAAFAEIVRRERRSLLMAARVLTGDDHEAEDAAQEALVAAHARLGTLRDVDAEIAARPDTPFEDVVRVVDRVRAAGADRVLFRGTTPASTSVKVVPGGEKIIEEPIIEDRPVWDK